MKEYQSLLKDIKNQSFLPIYFIQGEEDFYIDKITQEIENNVLEEEQKDFNQHILYGLETHTADVLGTAKQFPFGAEKQLVIVKEAQHLDLNKDEARSQLLQYAENPQPQTILVFNYKNKKLNGNTKLSKLLKKKGYLYNSTKLYDNQLPAWISQHARSLQLKLDNETVLLLSHHIGNKLSTLDNELQKLQMIVGKEGNITPQEIEDHIGISKDFNNFELSKAIGNKDTEKAFTIIHYFEKNPNDHPVVLTVSTLYNLFTRIISIHTSSDKSDANLLSVLKLGKNYIVLNEYKTAARNYNLKNATRALHLLQEVDLKSKGIGSNEANNPGLLKDFVYKIFHS